jgi:hypothetical protein
VHVDLGAVVPGHLDLVLCLLVVDLGTGHPALADLVERRLLGLVLGCAGDRCLGGVVVADTARGHRAGADSAEGEHCDACHRYLSSSLHDVPPGSSPVVGVDATDVFLTGA